MANHVSSIKRARQDIVKRDRNRTQKSTMRTAIKRVHAAIAAGDQDTANTEMRIATSLIARSGRKNNLHKKQASRRISRINARIKAIKT
ncbi:MAG: 30S ribosomal protein S20 [Zetaproteobacteria bacterium]|nr:MAG: 30S ribosomal protein S20 [Zetaproteobacteria bacterium]